MALAVCDSRDELGVELRVGIRGGGWVGVGLGLRLGMKVSATCTAD